MMVNILDQGIILFQNKVHEFAISLVDLKCLIKSEVLYVGFVTLIDELWGVLLERAEGRRFCDLAPDESPFACRAITLVQVVYTSSTKKRKLTPGNRFVSEPGYDVVNVQTPILVDAEYLGTRLYKLCVDPQLQTVSVLC